jgi:hypothetical protein
MVDLLALAHYRGVEADLAAVLEAMLDAGELPAVTATIACSHPPPGHSIGVRLQESGYMRGIGHRDGKPLRPVAPAFALGFYSRLGPGAA